MSKKTKVVSMIVVMFMFCVMSIPVLGAYNEVIYLPEGQKWVSGYSVGRTGCFSYIKISCDSVYPLSGNDNFSRIQARILNSQGVKIMDSDYEVLKEGDGYKNFYIKEGYLNEERVYIEFRGNSSPEAEAVVNYIGL